MTRLRATRTPGKRYKPAKSFSVELVSKEFPWTSNIVLKKHETSNCFGRGPQKVVAFRPMKAARRYWGIWGHWSPPWQFETGFCEFKPNKSFKREVRELGEPLSYLSLPPWMHTDGGEFYDKHPARPMTFAEAIDDAVETNRGELDKTWRKRGTAHMADWAYIVELGEPLEADLRTMEIDENGIGAMRLSNDQPFRLVIPTVQLVKKYAIDYSTMPAVEGVAHG